MNKVNLYIINWLHFCAKTTRFKILSICQGCSLPYYRLLTGLIIISIQNSTNFFHQGHGVKRFLQKMHGIP